jgi:myo-inositol-1(or 4)-monophosphatase
VAGTGAGAEHGRQELKLAVELGRWAAVRMRQDVLRRANGAARDHDRTKDNAADLVTGTDEAIERQVRRRLAEEFPRHGVVGEEFGVTDAAPGEPAWVVDPVDGTTNFAHGLGWSAFSIGLVDEAGPVLGVVVDPWRDELFSAVRGQGAQCNGRAIGLTHPPDGGLAGSLVLTEWAGHVPWPGMSSVLAQLQGRHCTVRVMGSTALSLVQVAAGRAAAALIGAYHAIDALPAALIGIEAGALAPALTGGASLPVDGGPLLLAVPAVAVELVEIWRRAVSPGPANG